MTGESVPRALTDREGRFELDVDPGDLTGLFAQDMEDACGVVAVTRVDQPAAITIESPARGEVRVFRGPNPAPKENLVLTRDDSIAGLRFSYSGKTSEDGVFRLPALTPGGYTVTTWEEVPQVGCCFRSVVTRAAKVDLAPGSRPEITLGGTDLPAVLGKVASTDGEPLHGVWVRLIPKATAASDVDAVIHSAVTERDGSYSVYDVPPGDYEVRCFRRLALNDGGRTLEFVSDLKVPPGKGENVSNDVTIDLTPFLPLEPGQPAPAIEGTTLDGSPFTLGDLQGQYVVVHFYAGWCAPCVETIGWFDRLTTELGESAKVSVVGISLDESEQEARVFAQEKSIDHPVIYAGSWASNPVRKAYRVVNIPTTVIVGPDGAIAHIDLHGQVLLDYLRTQLASAS
jgi:peroxiredoxin